MSLATIRSGTAVTSARLRKSLAVRLLSRQTCLTACQMLSVGDAVYLDISSLTSKRASPVPLLRVLCARHALDARYCCEKSSKVFPNASRVDRTAKKRNTGKGRKPGAGRGKPSSSSSRPNHTPLSKPFSYDTHGEAVKDVPKDVIAAMVTLNRYHKAGGASERRAAYAEENSSSK